MGGRFVWSSTSDVIGRKPTYGIYLGVGALPYLTLVLFGHVVHRAVRGHHGPDPQLLRRRVRDGPGVPQGHVAQTAAGRSGADLTLERQA